MGRTGTPAPFWLLCLQNVIYLLNHLSVDSLQWKTPLEDATGQVPDISALLQFRWWQPVYYVTHSEPKAYPSRTPEKTGRWVGVASHQGDTLTHLILTDDTLKVIPRSAVRSGLDSSSRNLRADRWSTDGGEVTTDTQVILSTSDLGNRDDLSPSELRLPSFDPTELIGKVFVRETVDGQKFKATVLRQVQEIDEADRKRISPETTKRKDDSGR